MYSGYFIDEGPYLAHYGVLGMKWGVRRYQNADGSLTAAGRKRYNKQEAKENYKKAKADIKKEQKIVNNRYKKRLLAGGDEIVSDQKRLKELKAEKRLAKADYKVAKGKNPVAAYGRAANKVGLRGSHAYNKDILYSEAIYSGIKKRRGKEFTDSMEKKMIKQFIGQGALAGAAVYAGFKFVEGIIDTVNAPIDVFGR